MITNALFKKVVMEEVRISLFWAINLFCAQKYNSPAVLRALREFIEDTFTLRLCASLQNFSLRICQSHSELIHDIVYPVVLLELHLLQ